MARDLPERFVDRPTLFEELMNQLLDTKRENPVAITTSLHGAGTNTAFSFFPLERVSS